MDHTKGTYLMTRRPVTLTVAFPINGQVSLRGSTLNSLKQISENGSMSQRKRDQIMIAFFFGLRIESLSKNLHKKNRKLELGLLTSFKKFGKVLNLI